MKVLNPNRGDKNNKRLLAIEKEAPGDSIKYNSNSKELIIRVEWNKKDRDKLSKILKEKGYKEDEIRGSLINKTQEVSPLRDELRIKLRGGEWDIKEICRILKPTEEMINDYIRRNFRKNRLLREILFCSKLESKEPDLNKGESETILKCINKIEDRYSAIMEVSERIQKDPREAVKILYTTEKFKRELEDRTFIYQETQEEFSSLIESTLKVFD